MCIRSSERLAEVGVESSVGSNDDSYDNALAETIRGLYETELIHRRAPCENREAVELVTLEWVACFPTIACSNPSATHLPQELRQTMPGNLLVRLPRRRPAWNQNSFHERRGV